MSQGSVRPMVVLRRLSVLCVACLCACLLQLDGCSQQGAVSLDRQQAIAREADRAMKTLNWESYAGFLHPSELEGFKEMLMPAMIQLPRQKDSIGNADLVSLLGRNFSITELQSASDEKFFVDVMNHVFEVTPELQRTFRSMDNAFVGAVADGDSLVHVVVRTRMSVGQMDVDEMNVMTLRSLEGEWKLRLSDKIEGVAVMLEQRLRQMP